MLSLGDCNVVDSSHSASLFTLSTSCSILQCLIFGDINSPFLNAVFKTAIRSFVHSKLHLFLMQSAFINDAADKTGCIKDKYKFQCTVYTIAVFNTAFKKGESMSPNINHFTIEIAIDDVNNDTHH